jgi:hypothetical protein
MGEEPNHTTARKPGPVLYKLFNTLCIPRGGGELLESGPGHSELAMATLAKRKQTKASIIAFFSLAKRSERVR